MTLKYALRTEIFTTRLLIINLLITLMKKYNIYTKI